MRQNMKWSYGVVVWLVLASGCSGGESGPTTAEWMRKAGLGKWLDAPVTASRTERGIYHITDKGVYIFQYDVETPAVAAEPNVVIEGAIRPAAGVNKAVFVTHGWGDKAAKDWPEQMAEAIAARVDPNEWMCGCFGWSGGSVVITSVHAARYARDIGGPRLAAAGLKLSDSVRHVHLIGHSAGSWVIDAAAKRIVKERPGVEVHLTFLDAYVPSQWDPDELGAIAGEPNRPANVWAEHYYTRDITYNVTQQDLKHAHNVDITAIDPLFAEHEFPYRWYEATMTGTYDRWDEKGETVYKTANGVEYGFARGREAGEEPWRQSKQLPCGEKAVILGKQVK